MQHSKCCVRNVPRVRIPNSPPKREVMLWHCFSFFVWDSNKEGADLSAEENSPVDCFCRRGQGAKRREGIRQYAEKIPNSPPKWKAGRKACFLLWQNKKRDSNKEGADLSAEENSPVDCFCRRGQGAKRREGIRQYAEKSLTLRQSGKQVVRPAFCFGKTKRGIRTRREQTCLRKKTVRWTVFADVVKEQSDAKAYGSMPKNP